MSIHWVPEGATESTIGCQCVASRTKFTTKSINVEGLQQNVDLSPCKSTCEVLEFMAFFRPEIYIYIHIYCPLYVQPPPKFKGTTLINNFDP